VARARWWAWLAIYAVASVLAAFSEQVVDILGEARAVGFYGVAGTALGWTWYRLFPRPLAERMGLVSVTIGAVSGAALVFGAEWADPDVSVMILPGVLAGLVITETQSPGATWRRQKRTALTSRETMRELR
jgi:hypothetical protein